MKRTLVPATLALALSFFAACGDQTAQHAQTKPGGFRPPATPVEETTVAPDEAPSHSEKPPAPTAEVKPTPAVPEQPVSVGEIPYGKPVPGKPGYVFSPSEPYKYVDVRGYPPGTEVKDAYSDRHFLVP